MGGELMWKEGKSVEHVSGAFSNGVNQSAQDKGKQIMEGQVDDGMKEFVKQSTAEGTKENKSFLPSVPSAVDCLLNFFILSSTCPSMICFPYLVLIGSHHSKKLAHVLCTPSLSSLPCGHQP